MKILIKNLNTRISGINNIKPIIPDSQTILYSKLRAEFINVHTK